jgi:hypothetical protein
MLAALVFHIDKVAVLGPLVDRGYRPSKDPRPT